MGSGQQPPGVPHVEPVPIVEEFTSGLGFFEIVGDVTFLVFYVDQILPPEFPGPRERRIMRKLVMPNDARERMRRMLESAAGETPRH